MSRYATRGSHTSREANDATSLLASYGSIRVKYHEVVGVAAAWQVAAKCEMAIFAAAFLTAAAVRSGLLVSFCSSRELATKIRLFSPLFPSVVRKFRQQK